MNGYVHGYDDAASGRLDDQAEALSKVVHDGTRYAEGETVIEVGCGVGSQTEILAANSPKTSFTAVDVSAPSLAVARERLAGRSGRVRFQQASIYALPYEEHSFDHAFVCFVLEHLSEPLVALREVMRVTRPGGTVTVIDGDHGSVLMHPESREANAAIACQVSLQARAGGDAMIGRRLYPLMVRSGLARVSVEPRQIYTDDSNPQLARRFTLDTFAAMIAGVRQDALSADLIEVDVFDEGIAALERASGPEGTFAYTFFRGVGTVRSS